MKKTELKVEPIRKPEPEAQTVSIEIEAIKEETSETDNLANKLVEDFGQFDPTLELSNYQFPPIDLLKNTTPKALPSTKMSWRKIKIKLLKPSAIIKLG